MELTDRGMAPGRTAARAACMGFEERGAEGGGGGLLEDCGGSCLSLSLVVLLEWMLQLCDWGVRKQQGVQMVCTIVPGEAHCRGDCVGCIGNMGAVTYIPGL